MHQPRLLVAAAALAALAVLAGPARGADDNVLRRDKGIVTYKLKDANPQSLTGSIAVGDSVLASTSSATLATLQLADSSEIRIGDRTTVRVGDLRTAAGANPAGATIYLRNGAVRFNIQHPAGARANYRFITPTSQLAVRGTVGYFVHGATGDQIYCVTCQDGDVTIVTKAQTFSIHSGQTLNVATRNGSVTGTAIVPNRTVNNPAIDQFLGGVSPFGQPAAGGSDPTGSRSGRGP